jgi:hypothetical protein
MDQGPIDMGTNGLIRVERLNGGVSKNTKWTTEGRGKANGHNHGRRLGAGDKGMDDK